MKLTSTMRQAFVRAAIQDVPQTDYREVLRVYVQKAVYDSLPPIIQRVYEDTELRKYLAKGSEYYEIGYVHMHGIGHFTPTEEHKAEIARIEKLYNDQAEKLNALEAKIYAVARAARTRAQLLNMLPEFEKYLPADEAAADRSLPCIANVVTDFVKAGWPKGEGTTP